MSRASLGISVLCAALAALSLLVLREPSYDPTAWLIWGREILHGTLDTRASPSWKPLPVAFTTLFALGGSAAAPMLWLVVARTGGLLGLVLAFRVARRLGGTAAGWLAVAGVALATDYLYNAARGDSEGLLVALVLGAVLLHLDGRQRAAFALAVLVACLRPETWPFVGAYGLVHLRRHPVTVLAAGALILAAWFLPDYLATGDVLRGATRATQPEPGSPAQAAFPFGAALLVSLRVVLWPFYLGTAVVLARRPNERVLRALAAGTVLLTLETAAFAQIGFTGNLRYFTLAGALFAVVGSVGVVRAAREIDLAPARAALAGLAAAAVVLHAGGVLTRGGKLLRDERVMRGDLTHAIALAGGPAAMRACGHVAASPYQRAAVAYRLEVAQARVASRALTPGVMLVRKGLIGAQAGRLPVVGVTDHWVVRGRC